MCVWGSNHFSSDYLVGPIQGIMKWLGKSCRTVGVWKSASASRARAKATCTKSGHHQKVCSTIQRREPMAKGLKTLKAKLISCFTV